MITSVMGILNVTPDSFSDGGKYYKVEDAVHRAKEMIDEGAGIIDVGGESTRPGAAIVSAEEEIERVAPVIEGIKRRFDIKVSLDTYKAKTAREGIKAGADIINDIGGLLLDEGLGDVVSSSGVTYVLMHNLSRKDVINNTRNENEETPDDGFMDYYLDVMRRLINNAVSAGIPYGKIIIDPGIGFNKTQEENICILRNLGKLCKLGIPDTDEFFPVLLGVSRKSVIEYVYKKTNGGLNNPGITLPTDKRLPGTLAMTAKAVECGVRYIRVHDVKENVDFINMYEALING